MSRFKDIDSLSTKDKILVTAHKLFADKGFNGVSIRELAKLCDCNVASINYHFKNKENLYIETVQCSIAETRIDLKSIYDQLDEKTTVNFSLAVFSFFIEHAEDLKTAFKVILDAGEQAKKVEIIENGFPGPPGGEYLAACILNDVPNAKDKDIGWAVRSIFSQIFHKSLMSCNNGICDTIKELEGEDVFEKDIARFVKVVVQDL